MFPGVDGSGNVERRGDAQYLADRTAIEQLADLAVGVCATLKPSIKRDTLRLAKLDQLLGQGGRPRQRLFRRGVLARLGGAAGVHSYGARWANGI